MAAVDCTSLNSATLATTIRELDVTELRMVSGGATVDSFLKLEGIEGEGVSTVDKTDFVSWSAFRP
jgi:hypothetical protein